jgi:hypothetical protein
VVVPPPVHATWARSERRYTAAIVSGSMTLLLGSQSAQGLNREFASSRGGSPDPPAVRGSRSRETST